MTRTPAQQTRRDLRELSWVGQDVPSMAPEFEPDTFTPALERLEGSDHPGLRLIAAQAYGHPGCSDAQEARARAIFGPEAVADHGLGGWGYPVYPL